MKLFWRRLKINTKLEMFRRPNGSRFKCNLFQAHRRYGGCQQFLRCNTFVARSVGDYRGSLSLGNTCSVDWSLLKANFHYTDFPNFYQ